MQAMRTPRPTVVLRMVGLSQAWDQSTSRARLQSNHEHSLLAFLKSMARPQLEDAGVSSTLVQQSFGCNKP